MSQYEVVEAKPWHCGAIVRKMREEHQEAVAWLGINSHREIRDKFDASTYRRALMINGKLAGLGGVVGTAISAEGFVWLALTNEASRHPIVVTRIIQRQLAEIMLVKRILHTCLIPEDKTALQFAMKLGFEITDPIPRPLGRGRVIAVQYRLIPTEMAA